MDCSFPSSSPSSSSRSSCARFWAPRRPSGRRHHPYERRLNDEGLPSPPSLSLSLAGGSTPPPAQPVAAAGASASGSSSSSSSPSAPTFANRKRTLLERYAALNDSSEDEDEGDNSGSPSKRCRILPDWVREVGTDAGIRCSNPLQEVVGSTTPTFSPPAATEVLSTASVDSISSTGPPADFADDSEASSLFASMDQYHGQQEENVEEDTDLVPDMARWLKGVEVRRVEHLKQRWVEDGKLRVLLEDQVKARDEEVNVQQQKRWIWKTYIAHIDEMSLFGFTNFCKMEEEMCAYGGETYEQTLVSLKFDRLVSAWHRRASARAMRQREQLSSASPEEKRQAEEFFGLGDERHLVEEYQSMDWEPASDAAEGDAREEVWEGKGVDAEGFCDSLGDETESEASEDASLWGGATIDLSDSNGDVIMMSW